MANRLRVANSFSALAKKTAGRMVVIERAGFIGLAVFGVARINEALAYRRSELA
ncbi:MAG: hypothetical protein H8E20_07100 [Verrucomicrobia bacterium]|nr:hypothetical protein [Verrucomicrobiota bacterium]